MQRAHRTSAAIFGEGGVAVCTPGGSNAWHAWLAALFVGLLGFRSLPGPPLTMNTTPPPGGVLGSGKSETPWLRMHREYATNLVLVDPEPEAREPFEPPQPAARAANPSTAAIATVHFIPINMWQPFGSASAQLYSYIPNTSVTALMLPQRSIEEELSRSEAQAGARRDHWRSPGVDGVDDLGRVDVLQIGARDAQVCVAELPLDDRRRHAFASHLERVSVPKLMRREPASHSRLNGEPPRL